MSYLQRLFGRPWDPLKDWPEVTELPEIDLESLAIGDLRMGDPLDAAFLLGRPSSVEQPEESRCSLVYERFGLRLEFVDGRLAEARFAGPAAASLLAGAGDAKELGPPERAEDLARNQLQVYRRPGGSLVAAIRDGQCRELRLQGPKF
jgi:hypothetical protein